MLIGQMKDSVSIVLVGAGGMGLCYLKALFEEFSPSKVHLLGVVEPYPEMSVSITELRKNRITTYPALREFYDAHSEVDLAIIASPMHHHVPQSCQAIERGSHVLCEKPLAATVQDARRLITGSFSSDLWVKIGYQWSFSEAIRALKKDIIQGRYGKALRLKTLCFWPRDLLYFQRNDWAGKKKNADGHWVLDSPANNAMAHFLHNAFYILGEHPHLSATPREVTAELYRAYPIDNYDTVACRIWTVDGTEILFYASHSTFEKMGPMFFCEFEKGHVSYGEEGSTVVAVTRDGDETNYGSPEKDPFRKLFDAVSAVHTPRPVVCGPQAAFPQTLCMNGIQDSVSNICPFQGSMITREKNRIWVDGLGERFHACYREGILPSEAGISWARRGKTVDLREYEFFPGGKPREGDR
jgi:predicted dehydrogenase